MTSEPVKDDEKYEVVTSTALNIQVRFYEETWKHITDEHAELGQIGREPIMEALKDPSSVHVSGTNTSSLVFVDETTVFGGHPLVVPVRLVANSSGRVTTSLFNSDVKKHPVIWKKDQS